MRRRRRLPAAKARSRAIILRSPLERVVFVTAMAASVAIVIVFAV